HLGKEFDGIVSSVTKFGVFVLFREFDVDGLIKIDELGGDRFEYDEDNLRLVGRKTGLSFEIGMPLRIQVLNADIEGGRIDFGLADKEEFVGPVDSARGKKKSYKNKPGGSRNIGKHNNSKSQFDQKPNTIKNQETGTRVASGLKAQAEAKPKFKNLSEYLDYRKAQQAAQGSSKGKDETTKYRKTNR